MSNSGRPGSPLDLYKMCTASAPEYLTPKAPPVLGRLGGAQRGSWKRECEDLGREAGLFSLPSSPDGHLNISSRAGLAGLVLSSLTQSRACMGQAASQAWVTLWFGLGYPSQA